MSRHPFLELHASDRDQCLSRLRAELDGAGHSGLAADIGTAVHRVAEAVTLELLEHPAADAREVAQATLKTVIRELDLPPAGIVDALEILDKALAYDSRIRLGVEPGWSGKPEVRWALDADLEIVTAVGVEGALAPAAEAVPAAADVPTVKQKAPEAAAPATEEKGGKGGKGEKGDRGDKGDKK